MSEYIDERIVSIKFDNSGFAEGVSETQKSLDNLNESLQFKGANEGGKALANTFKDISTEAKKTDLSPLGNAVDGIKNKFSALETIAVGALLKIGSQAVELGEKLLKSVAIDPIANGFQKYQSILTSQQALTAALGGETDEQIEENAKKIQKDLDLLTKYADETSYSLSDMISNVSKFANYGIDLDDAAYAMMGIANASAKSGQPLWKATHAMEGFSKAMGQGYMSYQIWNNQLKTAEIGTMDFKNTFMETAKEFLKAGVSLGENVRLTGDNLEYLKSKEEGWMRVDQNFNESLTKGRWMTNEVMLAGLSKYSASIDDLFKASEKLGVSVTEILQNGASGFDKFSTEAFMYAQQSKTLADVTDSLFDAISTTWYGIFQSLIGDYKQTVELWSNFAEYVFDWFVYPLQDVAAMIKEFAQSTSSVMEEGTDRALTYRELIVGSFMNILEAIQKVIDTIREAFNAVFRPFETMPGILKDGTEKLYEFTQSLILTDEKADKLRNTFITIFSTLKKIWEIIKAIGNFIKEKIFPIIKSVANFALRTVAIILKGLIKLASTFSSFLSRTFGIADYMQEFKDALIDAGYALDKITEEAEKNADTVEQSKESYSTWNDELQKFISRTKDAQDATASLTKEQKKNKKETEKSYLIKGGYDGQSYLSYEQAQEKGNNKRLAEVIEQYKITERQYNKFIAAMKARDEGAALGYTDIMNASELTGKAFTDLYQAVSQTTSAYKKTDKAIESILNKDKEAGKWETIWDGINEAQKETLITYGDQEKALKMYFHEGIKDYGEIAKAIGLEEWKVRRVIRAYEEAYAVEAKLAKEKKEATVENMDAARQELGYITRKKEETEKEKRNTIRDQSIAERNARIAERRNKTLASSSEASKKAGQVIANTIKQIPVVGTAFSVIQKIFGTVNTESEKTSKKVKEISNEIAYAIEESGEFAEENFITSKKNFYEVSDAAEDTANSIKKIGDAGSTAAESLSKSSKVMSDAAKTAAENAAKASQNQNKENGKKNEEKNEENKEKKVSYGDSMKQFLDEESFEKEKNKWVSKFNEIWAEIRKGFEQLQKDFTGFFKDPLKSLSESLQTIKGTFENIRNIVFPKKDEANVAGATATLDETSLTDKLITALQKIRDFLKEPIHWNEFWNLALLNHEVKVMSTILENFSNSISIQGLGDDILKIGTGIGILVAALFAMSKIDSKAVNEALDLFERLAWIIGLLTGGITAMMAIYNVSSVKNIPTAIESILNNALGGKSAMEQVAGLLEDVSKSLAIMVAAMAGLMIVIDHVKPDSVAASIAIMTAFLVIIFGLMVFMAEMNKKYTTTASKKEYKLLSANVNIMNSSGSVADIMKEFAKALLVFVGAFLVITKVIDKYFTKKSGDFDYSKFSIVSGILIGMLAGIMLLADVMVELQKKMKKTKFDDKQIKAVSKMINPMVQGLIVFIAAFWAINKIVSNMPDGTFIPTVGIFAAMIGALIGLVILMVNASKKMKPKDATKIKELSKAIDLMSLSIIIIAGSLSAIFLSVSIAKLSGIDYIAIGVILAAMIGALIGLVALILSNAKKISSKEAKNITTMAKAIDLISASILIIALGVSSVFLSLKNTNLDGTDYLGIGIILIAAIAALALITVYLVKESQKMSLKDANRLKDLGKVMLMIGGALTLVMLGAAAIISAFTKYDSSQASKLTGASGGGGGAGGGNIGEAKTGNSGLIWGIVAIVGIFAIMIAELAIIAKKLDPADAIVIKALGVAMIEIGAAVSLIGLTISQLAQDLSEVNPEAMKASIITIGVILGVLVALFGIIAAVIAATGGATGAGAASMAAAVAVLGGLAAVLLLVSAAVYVLAKAIEEMVVALTAVGEANNKLISGLETIRDAMPVLKDIIIETVKAIVVGVIQAITESVAEIAKSIVECFVNILQTIAENAPKILDALEKIGPVALKVITWILTLVFQALTEAMPQFREWFMKLLDLIEEGIGDILQFLIDEGVPKLEEIIGMILAFIIDEVIPQLEEALVNFVKWLGDLGVEIVNSLTKIWNAIVTFITDTVFPGIEEVWSSLLDLVDQLIDDMLTFLDNGIQDWGDQIIDIIVDLIGVIETGSSRITDALESLLLTVADNVVSLFETGGTVIGKLLTIPAKVVGSIITEFKNLLKGGSLFETVFGDMGEGDSIEAKAGNMWERIEKIFTDKDHAGINEAEQISESAKKWGIYIANGVAKGLDTTPKDLQSNINSFWKNIEKGYNTAAGLDDKGVAISSGKAYKLGENTAKGILKGLKDFAKNKETKDAAAALWKEIDKQFRKSAKIKSPSREAYKWGQYIGKGLTNGLEKSTYEVGQAAVDMWTSFSEPMTEQMDSFAAVTSSMLSQLLDANMDFNPVITPVFDMSNLEAATSSMSAFFDAQDALEVAGSFNGMQQSRAEAQNNQNGGDSSASNGPTYNYVQNNYSPKALSAIEIYRRTKNQLNFRTALGG